MAMDWELFMEELGPKNLNILSAATVSTLNDHFLSAEDNARLMLHELKYACKEDDQIKKKFFDIVQQMRLGKPIFTVHRFHRMNELPM